MFRWFGYAGVGRTRGALPETEQAWGSRALEEAGQSNSQEEQSPADQVGTSSLVHAWCVNIRV